MTFREASLEHWRYDATAPPSEREDRVLNVPDVFHHGYPEVVALPAAGGELEVDDDLPGEREEYHHRDRVGEEAGGGSAGEDGDIEHRGSGEEEIGVGRDERDLPAGVVAGDDLEVDEDEREVNDREAGGGAPGRWGEEGRRCRAEGPGSDPGYGPGGGSPVWYTENSQTVLGEVMMTADLRAGSPGMEEHACFSNPVSGRPLTGF